MAISRPLAGGFCRSAAMRKRNWGWSARVARAVMRGQRVDMDFAVGGC